MKERPVIFTADSVRAILAGSKTQTRRVVTPQPKPCDHYAFSQHAGYPIPTEWKAFDADGTFYCATCGNGVHQTRKDVSGLRCPYGVSGDRLWVKEASKADNETQIVRYKLDAPYPDSLIVDYKSPIFMPRWASRITLEISAVRVQRVQEISEEDAAAEGVEP